MNQVALRWANPNHCWLAYIFKNWPRYRVNDVIAPCSIADKSYCLTCMGIETQLMILFNTGITKNNLHFTYLPLWDKKLGLDTFR